MTTPAEATERKPGTAVERLAELPLSPSLPNSRELASLERLASAYASMPGLAPYYKGKPEAVLAALLTAHSLGLPTNPVIVNQFYEVNGRLFPSTQIVIALAANHGVEVWFDDGCDVRQATAYCRRQGSERTHSYTYTIEMAAKAKLAQKDVWVQHPEIMLRYRAASRLLRTVAADVVLGIPSGLLDGDVGIDVKSRAEMEAEAVPVAVADDEPELGDIEDAELVDDDPRPSTEASGERSTWAEVVASLDKRALVTELARRELSTAGGLEAMQQRLIEAGEFPPGEEPYE